MYGAYRQGVWVCAERLHSCSLMIHATILYRSQRYLGYSGCEILFGETCVDPFNDPYLGLFGHIDIVTPTDHRLNRLSFGIPSIYSTIDRLEYVSRMHFSKRTTKTRLLGNLNGWMTPENVTDHRIDLIHRYRLRPSFDCVSHFLFHILIVASYFVCSISILIVFVRFNTNVYGDNVGSIDFFRSFFTFDNRAAPSEPSVMHRTAIVHGFYAHTIVVVNVSEENVNIYEPPEYLHTQIYTHTDTNTDTHTHTHTNITHCKRYTWHGTETIHRSCAVFHGVRKPLPETFIVSGTRVRRSWLPLITSSFVCTRTGSGPFSFLSCQSSFSSTPGDSMTF